MRRRDWCALVLSEVTGPEPTVLGEILGFALRNLPWDTSYFVLGQFMGGGRGKLKGNNQFRGHWPKFSLSISFGICSSFSPVCRQSSCVRQPSRRYCRAWSVGKPGGAPAAGAGRGRDNHCSTPACWGDAGKPRIRPRRALFLPEENVLIQVVLGD